jgi:protein-histidine pros-kinase
MKLLLKFNIIFVLVMALGVGVSAYISRDLLQRHAQEEVLNSARQLMENALAVRNYTATQITKLLETQMKYEFLPQSVPSYSATEVLATLRRKRRSTPPTRATARTAGRWTSSTSSATAPT